MPIARSRTIAVLLAVSIVVTFAAVASAASKPTSYRTPDEAVTAFVAALRSNDLKTLVTIFGEGSERLFESNDPVADQNTRARFLELYDARHELAPREDGSQVLLVGPDPWPLPVSLVRSGKKWVFDTEGAFDEIINRRIGRNELQAIQTCLAVADAQREYYARDRDGDGILEYAQSIHSTVGLKNGLFWSVDPGEPPSPLGEFVAAAAAEGYTRSDRSYHGYRYRLLSAQGPAAPDGAYDYLAHDDQIGGFAILAYPAAWGDSGIMTFILNHGGVVYQRDLGPSTEAEALKITSFDPSEGWTKVPEKDLEALPAE